MGSKLIEKNTFYRSNTKNIDFIRKKYNFLTILFLIKVFK